MAMESGQAATRPLGLAKIASGELALLATLNVVGDLVALTNVHAGTLHVGDVQEDVLGAVLGLNEAEALGAVEPLNGADRHKNVPMKPETAMQYCLADHLQFETETSSGPK